MASIAGLPAADLVLGVISSQSPSGSKVPADPHILDMSSDLCFDRSILLGKSNDAAATMDCTDKNFMESRNIALQGTLCTCGSRVGIAVGLGNGTVFSCDFDRQLCVGHCGVHSRLFDEYVLTFLAIEGLPVCVTLSLTVIAHAMHSKSILCKSLMTVESLGAIDFIASQWDLNVCKAHLCLDYQSLYSLTYLTAVKVCMPTPVMNFLGLSIHAVYLVAAGRGEMFWPCRVVFALCFPEIERTLQFHNIMVLFDLPTVRCLFLRFILGYWEHLSMGS
ncbi:hypothetical protein B0H14DRAFT_2596715 [Mycena olivaceomarginata]|nr:hypothetical protein B0H14DRAFT_2596715 [Mycena olivaceomarginata]